MNWLKKLFPKNQSTTGLTDSILYNETTFYNQFVKDLLTAKGEVIIESPYLTTKRLKTLLPLFEALIARDVKVFIITKDPQEHDEAMAIQAETWIQYFEELGVQVLLIHGGHHRKLAMIDREILWEGSLNILSQSWSREFMRRIRSSELTEELFQFLQFNKINELKK